MVGDPSDQDSAKDKGGSALVPPVPLTATQHRILDALCRPAGEGNRYTTPATNQEIAAEVLLSVDAVKAHLRTLFRKFGIEDLPHNRKRARLVELVLEGGYLGKQGAPPRAALAPDPAAPTGARRDRARRDGGRRDEKSTGGRLFVPSAVVVVVLGATLVLAGVLLGGGGETASSGVAAYKSDVRGYCRLALSGQDASPPGSPAQRALSYLEVIETLRGRLESVPPPAASNRSLERFRDGLARAARFTGMVAEGPPPAGSREQANVVAELTIAAGQVQAGAIGYELGKRCRAMGSLVARSAQNAATP